MKRHLHALVVAALLALLAGFIPTAVPLSPESRLAAADTCSQLVEATWPDTRITAAAIVAPGTFTPGGTVSAAAGARFAALPAFCRVQATLTPTADSEIRMEVWLPADGWNGRFQAVGGRALAGVIVYPAMASALADGYATASTDTGHVGAGGGFAAGHPEKVTDHGYRAVHVMTVAARQAIERYYGRPSRKNYWNGCSLGGRQGLAEAQRYPGDYDGIITGDIANDITGLYAARLAQHQFVRRSPAATLDEAALKVLNAGVLNACDALDGVTDGVLEQPSQCRFDAASLTCRDGATTGCLNAEQVESVRRLYAPTRLSPGTAVISNGLAVGSEPGWLAVVGPEPERNSVEVYRHMVFKDAAWDWRAFSLEAALAAAKTSQLRDVDATDPNLQPFFARGGKLLMYHGWADPQTPSQNGLDYYARVRATVGAPANDSIRMFMVPGMGHCEGGVGTDTFDPMAPLVTWVEDGRPPQRIEARRVVAGKTVRSRPLCPSPEVARWSGTGSPDESANFRCVAP